MMNRTWKSVFSVLLSLAILLPMAPAVRADGGGGEAAVVSEATAVYATESSLPTTARIVKLTPEVNGEESNTIYYRSGKECAITVTATVEPSDYTGAIEWSFEPSNAMLSFVSSKTTPVSNGKAAVQLRATGSDGSVTLTAKASDASSFSTTISIKPDTIDLSTAVFSKTSLSVEVGKTGQVGFQTQPLYLSGDKASVTFSSDNTDIATVNATTGVVTGVKAGVARISAKLGDNSSSLGTTVTVTVSNPSTSLTGSATIGTNFSMKDIHTSLLAQFSSAYGEPSDSAAISFTDLNTVNGTLYAGSGVAVTRDRSYRFSDLSEMYLVPSGAGEFRCGVDVKDGAKTFNGTIVITTSVPEYSIRIPIDGSSNYIFGRASADAGGKTGVQLIRETIGASFASIEFGGVSAASSNVGTLYTSTQPSSESRVLSSGGTVVSSSLLDELYFTPSRAGTYSIGFTAYSTANGGGNVVCKGTLLLSVDGGSLDLSFTLNSVAPYTFSASPGSGAASLASLLTNAINSSVGTSWGGIKFDGAAAASSTGTLYQSNSYSYPISASDYISSGLISTLYYVPERTGTYEITYGVYASASSTNAIATGKLTIKTSTVPAGSSDITYATTVGNAVTLQEGDFIDYFQKVFGSKYELSYVVFEEYDGGGTFYHDTNTFLPYNSADFYTGTYSGSVPSNARYLSNLSFTAPANAGYTAVRFKCYGGTTASSKDATVEGKLCIYYTANDVPVVSYSVLNAASVDLKEADFVTAYNAATKTTLSKPVFTVQLLSAPGKGTLYQYYSGNSRRALTSSNISNHVFSVNDSAGSSVDQLTYIPGNKSSGTDEITYLVTSSGGAVLYVGTIQFRLSSDLTLNVTNDGSNFQLSDFYNASDSDPVLYVTFPQPSTGRVYVNVGGRYIAAPTGTKFYTASSSNGQYALTAAFYAPKANETGSVSIKCTAYRKSGVTNDVTITLNVLSKLSSGTFGDVKDVFNWAANSIDFASKMGLVNGTQLNPPLFSPGDTMRRSDFVLMLYRLAGSPAVSGSVPYTDVSSAKYYYNSAVWAHNNNIMRNVTTNNRYDPEGALTRQDFAQILFNYTAAMGQSTANSGSISSYSDASSVSANTREGVTWAVAKGYITSAVVGSLYIEPTRSATRAEISTLLHRYLTY